MIDDITDKDIEIINNLSKKIQIELIRTSFNIFKKNNVKDNYLFIPCLVHSIARLIKVISVYIEQEKRMKQGESVDQIIDIIKKIIEAI